MAVTAYDYPQKVYSVFSKRASCTERARIAHTRGFDLEALVILHSLMENYTYILLILLGISFNSADRIFQCLEYLKLHIDYEDINPDIAKYLRKQLIESNYIDKLYLWRQHRNEIIHDYAIGSFSKDWLDLLASQGFELFDKLADVVEEVEKIQNPD